MTSRMDYVLIWGHGVKNTIGILDIINKYKDLEIKTIVKYKVNSVPKFVQDVYSTDTYPMQHLLDKTRYLLNTPSTIIFILMQNNNPQEKKSGSGAFRGVQCELIGKLKIEIRNAYNPKFKDKNFQEGPLNKGVSSEHVIHTSDFESQVVHLAKLVELHPLNYYKKIPNKDIYAPHHIKEFDKYIIKDVLIDKIYADILDKGLVNIKDTPHYKFVLRNKEEYINYYNTHLGITLKDNHTPKKFEEMISNFNYGNVLSDGRLNLIIVNKQYTIIDGIHRLAILAKDQSKAKVVVI